MTEDETKIGGGGSHRPPGCQGYKLCKTIFLLMVICGQCIKKFSPLKKSRNDATFIQYAYYLLLRLMGRES